MKILLIAGGWSSEREISLKGAENVRQALLSLGHKVTCIDPAGEFSSLLEQAASHDFAFINLHGRPGEDGLIQAMLDAVKCPYQGSGPAGSFLALHKAAAKEIFRKNGLATADWEFLPERPAPVWQPALAYPLFVKSDTGGSSLHLGRAANRQELEARLNEIFSLGEEALMEPALSGKELTCGILGDSALPPILIEPQDGAYFDFKNKYAQNGAMEICPAPISGEATAEVQEMALAAHRALGLAGYSRADFILDGAGNITILEVNTLPGMTKTSLLPKEATQIGMDFPELIGELVRLGLETSR